MENLMNIVLTLYDHLKDDEKSAELIDVMDSTSSNIEMGETVDKLLMRLEELGKEDVASELKELKSKSKYFEK